METIESYTVKAATRLEAVKQTLQHHDIIENLNTKTFKVTSTKGYVYLVIVTDVVTGQKENNIFKVEVSSFPK